MELSKSEHIRNALSVYENKAKDRPVQVTAPNSDHVVGWDWPKVDENTINRLEDAIEGADVY